LYAAHRLDDGLRLHCMLSWQWLSSHENVLSMWQVK